MKYTPVAAFRPAMTAPPWPLFSWWMTLIVSGWRAAHSSAFSAVLSFVEPSLTMMISMLPLPRMIESMQWSMYSAEL